jgi:hypothetical protein
MNADPPSSLSTLRVMRRIDLCAPKARLNSLVKSVHHGLGPGLDASAFIGGYLRSSAFFFLWIFS